METKITPMILIQTEPDDFTCTAFPASENDKPDFYRLWTKGDGWYKEFQAYGDFKRLRRAKREQKKLLK